MITKDEIVLSKMTEKDLCFVNTTRNIPSTRLWLENNSEITLKETQEWFLISSPKWFIINHENQKVGYIRTSHDTGRSICVGCDIHPDFRRKGYAKKTYDIFLDYLYKSGYVNIWLEVFEKNEGALSLYKNLGFVILGKRTVRKECYITMAHTK